MDEFVDGLVHIRQGCVLLLLFEAAVNLGLPALGQFGDHKTRLGAELWRVELVDGTRSVERGAQVRVLGVSDVREMAGELETTVFKLPEELVPR